MSSVQPPSPYVPPQGQTTAAPVEGDAVPADITKLPSTLNTTDRAITLRGEVQAVNQDGTVRIATPRGPIEVKLPEPVPQRGQSVEVQIPAGSPPRTATVTIPQQAQPQPLPPSAPLPNTPIPSPAQSLPNAPVPQTPPPVAGTPQQPQTAPQPPQVPTQHTPPIDEIIPAPRPNTNAQPPAAPQHGQPQANTEQPAQPQLSPQGLLNFLKNAASALMKSPVANTEEPAPQPGASTVAAQSQTAPQQQRPLQIGQMLRLTMLPLAQSLGTPTPLAATPNMALPSLTSSLPAGNQPTRTLILLPQSAQQSAQIPSLQHIQNLVTAPGTALTAPQGASIPGNVNPLARLLNPTLPATMTLHITPITPAPAAAVSAHIPVLNAAAQIPAPPDATPHHPIIAARPGIQIPALTQPMDVRVTAMLPTAPNVAIQSPAMATLLHGAPANPVMFARVTAQTPQGFPVVELPTFTTAPDGTQKPATTMMVLQFPARAIPPATVLRLDVLPMAPNAASAPATSFSALSSMAESVTWDALDDVVKSTGAQAPGQAANALQAALPKPGAAAFTAPVMMMAAALKSGDIAAWLGEKGLDLIRTSRRTDALARISNDFSVTKTKLDEPVQPADWKSLSLPMIYGQEVGRIQLYYRSFTGNEGEGHQGAKKNGTRFVMDLSLNRMGPMQIDGFSVGNRLDITLRSERSLSPGMREEMRARYSNAVNGIGFAGELNFNADPNHKGWVVMDDASRLQGARA